MSDELATTQWSVVVAARDGTETEARLALENLCRVYWQPLYSFLRHLGIDPEEAGDLTQAYFLELLEKDFLADVDAEKGRFRSFLFSSMRHFVSHERDRARALKRGGRATLFSLDVPAAEESYALQARTEMTPEDVFEKRWAMTVVSHAMDRLRLESTKAGSAIQFEQLRPYLTSLEPQVPYRKVAANLGMSEGAIKVAVHRLRKSYGECLRRELAETVADPADLDDELRHLLRVMRSSRPSLP